MNDTLPPRHCRQSLAAPVRDVHRAKSCVAVEEAGIAGLTICLCRPPNRCEDPPPCTPLKARVLTCRIPCATIRTRGRSAEKRAIHARLPAVGCLRSRIWHGMTRPTASPLWSGLCHGPSRLPPTRGASNAHSLAYAPSSVARLRGESCAAFMELFFCNTPRNLDPSTDGSCREKCLTPPSRCRLSAPAQISNAQHLR